MTTRRRIGCIAVGAVMLIPMVHQGATTPGTSTGAAGKESAHRTAVTGIASVKRVAATPSGRLRPQFGYRQTPQGGRQIFLVRPELQFAKTSYAGGRTVVVVAADSDRVEISTSATDGIKVTRGTQTVAFYHRDVTEADLDRTRTALAGSTAVRRLRQLVAGLDDDPGDGPGLVGLRLADATIGFLDGDVGALARLARRFRAQPSPSIRRVVAEEEGSCWNDYKDEVNDAWNDYEQCVNAFGALNPLSAACALEWGIRAEGAWAEYLGCVGFPKLVGD